MLAELNFKDLKEENKPILEESKTFRAPQKLILRELVAKYEKMLTNKDEVLLSLNKFEVFTDEDAIKINM